MKGLDKQISDILGKLIKFVVVEVGEKYYGDTMVGESHKNLLTREQAIKEIKSFIAQAVQEALHQQLEDKRKEVEELPQILYKERPEIKGLTVMVSKNDVLEILEEETRRKES